MSHIHKDIEGLKWLFNQTAPALLKSQLDDLIRKEVIGNNSVAQYLKILDDCLFDSFCRLYASKDRIDCFLHDQRKNKDYDEIAEIYPWALWLEILLHNSIALDLFRPVTPLLPVFDEGIPDFMAELEPEDHEE